MTVTFILSPPLVMEGETPGTFVGVMVDAVRRLSQTCGVAPVFIESPSWNRAQAATIRGTTDALMPTNWSQERLAVFHFPDESLFRSQMSVMALKSRGQENYSGLEMFRGKRVGKLDKALIEAEFDRFVGQEGILLSERPTVIALFESLIRDRLDYVVGDVLSAIHYTKEIGFWEKVQVLDPPVGVIPQYLALSRNSPLFADTALLDCLLTTPQNADNDPRAALDR